MYTAYTSKRDTDPIEQTAWGRSPCPDYKIPDGGKANGRYWLEQCDRHVNIQVVGKLFDIALMIVPNSSSGVFDTVSRFQLHLSDGWRCPFRYGSKSASDLLMPQRWDPSDGQTAILSILQALIRSTDSMIPVYIPISRTLFTRWLWMRNGNPFRQHYGTCLTTDRKSQPIWFNAGFQVLHPIHPLLN